MKEVKYYCDVCKNQINENENKYQITLNISAYKHNKGSKSLPDCDLGNALKE